jgi:transmembrane 9 superfamily protein 2/4
MPYDYYSLPFCAPKKLGLQSENIGEALSGDRIENSVYSLEMKSPKSCAAACAVKLTGDQANAFKRAIQNDYRAHWIVDQLPVGTLETRADGTRDFVRGFPIGYTVKDSKKPGSPGTAYIYNHIRIIVQYHDNTPSESTMELARDTIGPVSPAKIVGFRVVPMSIKHQYNDKTFDPERTSLSTCSGSMQLSDKKAPQIVAKNEEIVFTYDVFWESSNIEWANRWDAYITASAPEEKVHMFAITNSILIVLFLSIMVAMILVRALRKDIAKYNDPAALEEAKEESGWKLVHGDVFRPPADSAKLLRCVCIYSHSVDCIVPSCI